MRNNPIFPPTTSYAKSTLLINKHWRDSSSIHQQSDNEVMKDFMQFLESDSCPVSVKAAFQRVKSRYEEHREFEEHADTEINYEGNECTLDKEDLYLFHVVNKLTGTEKMVDVMGYNIDLSLKHI